MKVAQCLLTVLCCVLVTPAVATLPPAIVAVIVKFAPGSANLTPADRDRIAKMPEWAAQEHRHRIVIESWSSKSAKGDLQKRRIAAVANVLTEAGYNPNHIEHAVCDFDQVRAYYQRVEAANPGWHILGKVELGDIDRITVNAPTDEYKSSSSCIPTVLLTADQPNSGPHR